MAIKVACFNLKGGVGKTTWAIILTQIALMHKQNVVAFDQDEQQNFSYYMSHLKDNVSFKNLLTVRTDPLKEEHFNISTDWLIIDCHPSANELSKFALKNADFVLIPVTPNINDVMHLDKIRTIAGENKELIQFPIVKIGFGAAGVGAVATHVDQIIIDMGFAPAVIGNTLYYKLITKNLYCVPRKWWSVGLSANQREPFENIYTELLHRYNQLSAIRNKNKNWDATGE
ncbi:MAG: ParA family protein [Synergistaceae bacterium]|nr:ParA family protein [Synergistaceae bacterium]